MVLHGPFFLLAAVTCTSLFAAFLTTSWAMAQMSHALQANYQVVIPSLGKLCSHLGVSPSYAGVIVGATDIAAIPITIGALILLDISCKMLLALSSEVGFHNTVA